MHNSTDHPFVPQASRALSSITETGKKNRAACSLTLTGPLDPSESANHQATPPGSKADDDDSHGACPRSKAGGSISACM
jgi:hypothetical protein